MKKWNRKLGTSKKEQGIITPKQPRQHKCGCVYKNLNDGKGWFRIITCQKHK